MRRTGAGWSKLSRTGRPLSIATLSSKLTQVAGYRQTICSIKEVDYLLRRIEVLEEPVVVRTRQVRADTVAVASEMIASLHWMDFETTIDLIFARTGWQRLTRVGGTQEDVDLVVIEPATGERASVQIKSRADRGVLEDYVGRFEADGGYDRMFFVGHNPEGDPGDHSTAKRWKCGATSGRGIFHPYGRAPVASQSSNSARTAAASLAVIGEKR